MTALVQKFLKDESGATAIEYGLIAALVSVASVAAFSGTSDALTGVFEEVSGRFANAVPADD